MVWMRWTNPTVAIGFCLTVYSAQAADTQRQAPAPAASSACLENEASAVPSDAFGFSSGSDVADKGSVSGGLEYNGAFGTRGASYQNHLGTAQVSYGAARCFEVGPYVFGSLSRFDDKAGLKGDTSSLGGGVEMKYKFMGRETHGFGATFIVDPNAARISGSTALGVPDGNGFGTSLKLAIDRQLAANLFGAVNAQYDVAWVGQDAYSRSSALTFAGALSTQVRDGIYVGAEARYLNTYNGAVFNQWLGHALYLGPTMYWQATKQVSLSAAWGMQAAGKAEGDPGKLNLSTGNRQIGKVKLGVSF